MTAGGLPVPLQWPPFRTPQAVRAAESQLQDALLAARLRRSVVPLVGRRGNVIGSQEYFVVGLLSLGDVI